MPLEECRMSLWPILAVMTAFVLGLVLLPILRRPGAVTARREYDLSVYRAQLRELEREAERGLLGPEEARAARLEVERRMLAADAEAGIEAGQGRASRRRWPIALVLLIALPALSAALYGRLGRPDLPATPFAERTDRAAAAADGGAADASRVPPVETMIGRLEERVAAAPDDLEGWLRLARAYELSEDPAEAAGAYERAIALDGGRAELHAGLAEASILAAGGVVTEKARGALERALALEPGNPRARFYQGLALLQRGERRPALEFWAGLVGDTPADAPYLAMLRARVTALAEELGLEAADVLPEPAPAAVAERPSGPPAADPEALRADVARLEAALARDAKDWQGWIRLARAHAALAQPAAAAAALARGAEAYEGAPFVQQQFVAAASELGVAAPGVVPGGAARARGPTDEQMRAARDLSPEEQAEMIRGMVEGLAARLAEQPDDSEGWRMLARSYGVLGETAKAAEAAKQAATLLPDDPGAQIAYAEALLALESDDAPLSAAAVDQLKRVVELDADNPQALFWLGRAAAEQGDVAHARELWQRLLAQIPADAPQRMQLQALIDRLDSED
jgi:cytochrome c-type biogenesis protein CcmH